MNYSLESLFGLKGEVIVICGGTRGIGREIANALADLGANLAIVATRQEACECAARELKERGAGDAVGYAADVTDFDAVQAAFENIYNHYGRIDGLVNCAGINHVKPLLDIDMEDFNHVVDVNFKGIVHCCKAAGRYMLPAHKGRIVNVSSLSALQGKSKYTAYSASKAAVNGFTRSLSTEWCAQGVNVNVLSPGLVVTDINRETIMANPEGYKRRVEAIPRGVPGRLEWLVAPAVMLLSAGSAHLTGQVICVDGGISTGDTFVMDKKD
ncbi:MAG: SDR family NAD(P)-dependent oxidoreductase [Gemmiger sp.]